MLSLVAVLMSLVVFSTEPTCDTLSAILLANVVDFELDSLVTLIAIKRVPMIVFEER